MSLVTGTRLGPYEIIAPAGAGGMGEVYRARDTRLERTVAIKVLPAHLSSSPELKQRFELEARAISQVSHPHICALYDVGSQAGTDYLVMEYLEGETLERKLAKGALAVGQALDFAIQIADALDKAHRHGIVHRDLKPANIMLTRSGAKLMDFGLAKLRRESSAMDSALTEMTAGAKSLTAEGTILGSLQYMSPEQLEGKEADALSDIFAFGTVLYEMLTGKPAFDGRSKASIIAAILSSEPQPVSALQPVSPAALDRLVRSCLAKDRNERWRDAYDLKVQLQWIREECAQPDGHPKPAPGQLPEAQAHAVRAYVLPPPESSFVFTGPNSGPVVVSPDGRRLAFTTRHQERNMLFVRPMDSTTAQPLAGTEGASFPFWSPDSRSLGFFAGGKLKRIEASGGPSQTLCDAPTGRGGSWNQEGTIIFAPTPTEAIYRVPAAGGKRERVTTLDPARISTHRWPWFLPDGRHFLYLGTQPLSSGAIYAGCLDTDEQKFIVHNFWNASYAPGFLLFVRDGALIARRFDAERLQTLGDDFTVGDRVMADSWVHRAIYSVSQTGVLVYQRGEVATGPRLVWFHRSGKPGKALPDPASFALYRLSPDGTKVAAADLLGGVSNIWIFDLVRNIKTRLTFDSSTNMLPVWSPDGTQIVFSSNRKGRYHLYRKAANGVGEEELLLDSSAEEQAQSWSPDGKCLAYLRQDPARRAADIWMLALSGRRKSSPYVESEYDKSFPQFSPDGRWLAYASNESGVFEIYVAPFPGAKGKWQVSNGGGTFPRWRGDGKEIFYLGPDNRLRATQVSAHANGLDIGSTHVLFQVQAVSPPATPFDVTADGKRFLINTMPVPPSDLEPMTLVVNWAAQLK